MSAVLKFCSICEDDVSERKRVKDSAGNYYCPGCWEARKSLEGSTSTTGTATASAAVVAPRTARPATDTATLAAPTTAVDPNFLSWPAKLGCAAVGLLGFAYLAGWPIYQATHHAREFSVSIEGMGGGWFSLCFAIFVLIMGPLGIDRRVHTGKPMTEARKKRVKVIGAIFGLAIAGLAFAEQAYIEHLGYTVRSWYETDKSTHR